MHKNSKAFTIIELLVVISIIGILTTISVISFQRIQTNTRDTQRSSKITIISEALEKYYDKNGEYPSCANMTESASAVSINLGNINPDVLKSPSAAVGTNSISFCDDLAAGIDAIAYVGDSSEACINGGACTEYTLEYLEEGTGNIKSVSGRHVVTDPLIPTVPASPVIVVTLNGINVQATITPVSCTLGTTEYGIDYRLNGGSWTSHTAWSATLTASQAASDGVLYGYRAQARCYADPTHISKVVTGSEDTYIDPITAPTAPAVAADTVGATTTYSWNTPTCASGTSARYQYRYTITPAGYDSNLVAIAASPVAFTTSTEAQTYTVDVQAQCYNTNTTSNWSSIGTTSYYRPVLVSAPSAPSIAVALNGANVEATITPVTCTVGTVEYGIDYRLNGGSWTGYTAWSATLTATQTANDGVLYGYRAQARCYVDAGNISTATTGSEGTYIDPVAAPVAPTVSASTVAATTTYSWNTPTCAAGTSARYQYRYTITPVGYDSGLIAAAASPVAFTTSTEGQTYTVAVQAQCYNTNASSTWSTAGSDSYYRADAPVSPPSAPALAVALNGANVQATITPVTCTTGTTEYGIDYQLNGGSWTGYTTWSTNLTASQTANDGVLYGYRAQARCYLDATHISTTATSTTMTYTDPIAAPAAPTVTANTVTDTTTYSWTAPTCAVGTSARYQYRFTITPSGYDSGLVMIAASPVAFTTSTIGQTYTVAVQAQCYNTNATSAWGATGTGVYTRPSVVLNESIIAYGEYNTDMATDIANTADGGFIMVGKSNSFGSGNDVILVKYSPSGTIEWTKTWGGPTTDNGAAVIQTSDGGYAVTGYAYGFGSGLEDMLLAKFNSSGNLLWDTVWGGTLSEYGIDLVQTNDGGIVVVGETESYGAGGYDGFMTKFSSSGSLLWDKTWGGTSEDCFKSVKEISDGSLIVTGYTASYGSDPGIYRDMVIARYSSSGTLIWNKTWGGSSSDQGNSIVLTNDGGYAVTGETSSYGTGGDVFMAKYDSAGTLVWNRIWGGVNTEYATSITQTNDGGLVMTGYTQSFHGLSNDTFLVKYSSDGTFSWNRTWGGSNGVSGSYDCGYSVIEAPDHSLIVAGSVGSVSYGGYDLYLAKFTSEGVMPMCTSDHCKNPLATKSSPTVTITSPTATVTTPSGSIYNPSATVSSRSLFTTTVVAPMGPQTPVSLPVLVPVTYLTYAGTAPTTTAVDNIDNGVATYDATYFIADVNSTGTAFYDITNMPSDFTNITSLTYNIRYKITPLANDIETLSLQIFKSDMTTPLTDLVLVKSATGAPVSEVSTGNITLTGTAMGNTKADWDGAVIGITTNHTVTGGKDNSIWSINEIELNGVYNNYH